MNALQKNELQDLPDEQERERFKIEDINAANWALRKISAAQAAIRERETLARAEVERVQQWLDGETQKLKGDIEFFEGLLHEYHQQELKLDEKRKTIKLPHGTLKMRAQQPDYQRDDVKLKEWAEANKRDVLIPQPPKLDWASLKKAIRPVDGKAIDVDTGEVIPGIAIVDRPPKFSVEVG